MSIATTIPQELTPRDGRFGSGPSKVRHVSVESLAAAADTILGTSHRRPAVKGIVAAVRSGLAELFELPAGYEVLIGNGGATAFWDAAAACLIERRSMHASFGEFSSKFASVVADAPHLDEPVVVEAAAGDRPVLEAAAGIDLYALTQCETSTGVRADVVRPAGVDAGALVAVDATSAAGGTLVDPTQFDAYYFSPQKCFGGESGIWLALCSPAAVDRIAALDRSGRWVPASLDLGIALENSRKDQTYNTPSIATLFILADSIRWMLDNGGLEFAIGRCDANADTIYRWAEQTEYTTPFVSDASNRSHTVATIDFVDDVDAARVASTLRAAGIVDVEPYRKLGRNQLRIAMFPSIETDDLARLTAAIDYVVDRVS